MSEFSEFDGVDGLGPDDLGDDPSWSDDLVEPLLPPLAFEDGPDPGSSATDMSDLPPELDLGGAADDGLDEWLQATPEPPDPEPGSDPQFSSGLEQVLAEDLAATEGREDLVETVLRRALGDPGAGQ